MKKIDYYEISKQKLKYLNYSDNTIKSYTFYIKQFLESIEISPTRLNSNDFQSYLNNYEFRSISQQNQIINAIKFFYKQVLNKKYNKVNFKRPKSEKKLPKVLNSELINKKLLKINNLKHKSILTLTYSVGLRVSEIVNLKIEQIDSNRMLIHIKKSKGKKDRLVPLSENVLEILRNYYKEYKPKEYLFNGQNSLKYSIGSCQKKYIKNI